MLLSQINKEMKKSFGNSWMKRSEMLQDDILQALDEGRELPVGIEQEAADICAIQNPVIRERVAFDFSLKLSTMPVRQGYPYNEPSDYDDIVKLRPDIKVKLPEKVRKERFDQVYGALLGRCCGCMLGSPVEGWPMEKIQSFMHETDNFPIRFYFRSDVSEELVKKYEIKEKGYRYGRVINAWVNLLASGPEDDDTDYTLLNLRLLEDHGRDFTTEECAFNWLYNMPMFHTAVSERVIYQNLANGIFAEGGGALDPYRETLGSQLRVDPYGYICPGDIEQAANMAWRDAWMTNTKNGIYGAMFVAAIIAAAAVTDSITDIINAGLSVIPEKSRTFEGINKVLQWHKKGMSLPDVYNLIPEEFKKTKASEANYCMCHAVPNNMIVTASLLYGNWDFERCIGNAVMAGFDTDCNGATVGSIAGTVLGASTLPGKWTQPLNNSIQTSIAGFDDTVRLDEIARRFLAIY
jgi:ADP-ribosylglycohydrolase